ncbi:MAG TPA: EF-hand domain-containing protein [Candidatus Omnitrophota bacterium]|nr:EF-hand domain-containing protein [Candidatus Omnitrophota bacterium]HQO58452.1 EF-hand domain-containing protein [Candidatus Omnitrophota bacterium]
MMKKKLTLVMAVIFLFFISVQAAQAQLIDYSRRNRYNNPGQNATNQNTRARTPAPAPKTASSAAKVFEVQNRFEKKYDLNRDGKLQGEELKKLFSDVVKEVENDGRSVVMSDIVEAYDANGDGYISSYEVRRIMQEINK